MRKMSKADAVKIIHDCAVMYNENLMGKNVLFISTQNDESLAFETLFLPQNFKHLTGVKTKLSGDQFFRAAVSNKLSQTDIGLTTDGIIEQKLNVLPGLMNIHLTARMVGDYDNSMPLLVTDKFAGTVTMAMGFTRVNGFYVPNTALMKDIRDITIHATRRKVAAILIKLRSDELYRRLTYIAKDLTVDDSVFATIAQEKADMDNLTADFPIPRIPVADNK